MVWDPVSQNVIVYGGAREAKGAKSGYDEVWSFDADKAAWQRPAIKGETPGGRAYHTAVWDPGSRGMLVFGGTANQFLDPPRENKVWLLRLHPE
jgi:hypothetical protein